MGYVDLNFLNPILFQYAPYIIDANEEWGRGIYVGIYLFIYLFWDTRRFENRWKNVKFFLFTLYIIFIFIFIYNYFMYNHFHLPQM